MWHEHTWGAADSISQPDRADVVAQWTYKRAFAVNADAMSRALLDGAAPPPGTDVEIVNTLAWPRSELVTLSAEQSKAGDRVRTSDGRTLASQRLSDGRLAVWVDGVPALGSRRLRVEQGRAQAPKEPIRFDGPTADTGSLRVQIDPSSGAIAHLSWREPGTRSFSSTRQRLRRSRALPSQRRARDPARPPPPSWARRGVGAPPRGRRHSTAGRSDSISTSRDAIPQA